MNLEKIANANASALSSAILWTVCSLFIVLLPDVAETIRTLILHGSTTGVFKITLSNFFIGGIVLVMISWVWGYGVLSWTREYVSRK